MSEPINELITIPSESAFEVFTKPDGIAPYLEQIRQAVIGEVPDISTDKGRKAVASLAFKVSKSKTYLDSVGKTLVDEYKEIPKKIDANRKQARDYLDALRDEVRQPLTEWEEQQKIVQSVIDQLASAYKLEPDRTADQIAQAIAHLEAFDLSSKGMGDRLAEAEGAKLASLESLREQLAKRQQYEAEQAELARLRAEAEQRERIEREQQIAREAAERAAQAEREAAERREHELKEAAERAERDKAEAERRAMEAQQQAELAEQRAREEAERQYLEEQRRLAEESAKREADREHRKAINTAALEAFVAGGLDREAAKLAVTLIAQRKIPAVVISY